MPVCSPGLEYRFALALASAMMLFLIILPCTPSYQRRRSVDFLAW